MVRSLLVLLLFLAPVAVVEVPEPYRIPLVHCLWLDFQSRSTPGPTWRQPIDGDWPADLGEIGVGIGRDHVIYRGKEARVVAAHALPARGGNPAPYWLRLDNGVEVTLQPWARNPKRFVIRFQFTPKGMEIIAPGLDLDDVRPAAGNFAWLWTE